MKKAFWQTEEGLRLLEGWARDGLGDEGLAGRMHVPPRALRRWRRDLPALDEAVARGRRAAWDVETALLHKATGYDQPVKKAFKVKTVEYDPDTGKKLWEKEELQTALEQVHVPANTTAQVFWLKNRLPERWKDKPFAPEAEEPDDGFFAALAEAVEREV